jgi:lactoylglutathione lyase
MKIEHIAIWTKDLERLRGFYEKYFGASAGQKYINPRKGFSSYFLSFASGARLELMQRPDIRALDKGREEELEGYGHLAMAVGDKEAVNALTQVLVADGFPLMDGPRYTGDGYYESVILDPDGNRIEITTE